MYNEQIFAYLQAKRSKNEQEFVSYTEKEPILDELYAALKQFDFEAYKIKLEDEIRENQKAWWTNAEKGIIQEEALYAIYFEYNYHYAKDVDAAAYGIGKWENFQAQTESFNMGYKYDFTTSFYAMPGLSLNFFDPLEKMDFQNLPEKYKGGGLYFFDGCPELLQLFSLNGMIAIHEVLKKMDSDGEFEVLNYKNNFMFLFGEHDTGKVYPLLVKERKA